MKNIKYLSDIYLSIISKISLLIFIVTLLLFAYFLFTDNFFDPNFAGDESKYLSDLLNAKAFGLGKAISEGASLTFLLISFSLDKFIDAPLYSLKITSLISGVIMISVLFIFISKCLEIKEPLKQHLILWLIYLFTIQTTIFSGVNDILLDLFGTLFFIILLIQFKNHITQILLLGLFLALMLATRKMALTYIFTLFIVFVLFSIIAKDHKIFNLKSGLKILFSFIFFILLFNIYPLVKHQKFSFDDKILKGEVNWAQWDYHNALLIDQGIQPRFSHISIKETEQYLKENGKDSLPSSFIEMVYFKPIFTLKEFFIDFAIGLKYIFRQTGLLTFLFAIFLFFRTKRIFLTKSVTSTDFIYLFSACYLFLISFIVIANIQGRWFMFFMPIVMALLIKDLNQFNLKTKLLFSIGNNLILSVMCFPYLVSKFSSYL